MTAQADTPAGGPLYTLAALAALENRQAEMLRDIESNSSDESRHTKPAPDQWSLTEVVQHLALVAEAMLRSARVRDATSPTLEHDGFNQLKRALASGVKRRAPTERIVPRPGVTWDQAVARSHAALRNWSDALDSGRLTGTSFPHPAAGELTLDQTLEFLSIHLDHHLTQVDRLLGR